jgi:hypothetical protein
MSAHSQPEAPAGTQDLEPVLDGELLPQGAAPPSTAIAHISATPPAIIAGEEPTEILEKAGAIATALADLIEKQNLAVNVGRGKHVEVGGWQALGALVGALGGTPLHAETVWSRRVGDEHGAPERTSYHAVVKRYHSREKGGGLRETVEYDVDGFSWEACVEIRTLAGVVVGRAEAMCSRTEEPWGQRDEFALRSMAETRAESRAYRRAVGWLVSIAGYSATPAEEMATVNPQVLSPELPWGPKLPRGARAAQASAALQVLCGPMAEGVWKGVKERCGYMPLAIADAYIDLARTLEPEEVAV